MTSLALTRHASVRANQRGVTNSMLETLIAHADIEAAVGGGCTVLRLSRQSLRDGELRVSLGPSLDRLGSLAVILANDTGEVVTVMRDHGGRNGRRYRRPQ
jgi:hypothetical protein